MANYVRQMTNDVPIYNELKSYGGYTLFAPSFQNRMAWLIDMKGNVVHFWEMEHPAGLNCKLLKNGNLMWLGRGPNILQGLNASADELVEVDWDGNEVWRYDDPRMHHDFEVLDNGNTMIMRHVELPAKVQKNLRGGVPGTELNGQTYGVQIREINRKGETLWQWNNWEHLDPVNYSDCPFCDREIYGYTNSVDVFPNGDVILSVRRMNTIIRISKKTGQIVWEWGPEHLLGHQHDVSVTEQGTVTVFDNGLHRRIHAPGVDHNDTSCFHASRLLEVDPKTGQIVWEYIDPMHLIISNFCGSVQKLPNGNYMACDSAAGTFYEITPEKEVVWKYVSPFLLNIPEKFGWSLTRLMFQAHRYGADFEGFDGKDLSPEKYEWVIQKKCKEDEAQEELVKRRLEMAGY